jgi:pyrimidine-specific ribonucleoside hydrolase
MRGLRLLGAILGLARVVSAGTVWIDTDISIGSPIREVDDAFALVLALHSPEIRIAGVSATFGNAPLGHTTRAAKELIRNFGADAGLSVADVYPGARSAADLGRQSAASDALAARLKKGKVTYLALGPLTNLATLLQLHPELASRIERVIFVGGQAPGTSLAFGPKRSLHIHDSNVFKDAAAARVVVRSNIPLTLVPIATASNLLVDAKDLRKLVQSGGAANHLARGSKIWLWFWTRIVKTKGGPVFDALAILPAAKPQLLSVEKRYAKMDDAGNLLVTSRLTSGARPVRYCTNFAPVTKRFVMERLRLSAR